MKISLRHALLLLLGGVVLVALIPGGFLLDRGLTRELERAAREELAVAPRLIADRNSARSDALMMHAKDLASAPDVVQAFRSGDPAGAVLAAEDARITDREEIVAVSAASAEPWAGPMPDSGMIDATRAGQMPVAFVAVDSGPAQLALAPVMEDDTWLGAAGVYEILDQTGAAVLAGLTRSEVIVQLRDGTVTSSTFETSVAEELAEAVATGDGVVEVVLTGGSRMWVAVASLGTAGRVLFARDVDTALAVLPRLRRGAAISAGLALLFSLLLGALASGAAAKPVQALAEASARLTAGDFGAPVPRSALSDVDRVGRSFSAMRDALARRLEELEAANRELAAQQERLQALQGELIQRDRLAASGRLVAELAHEIRNPVASIRNCLEVLDRRLADDPQGQVFSRLAIDELARMHELAEGLLDLNRPLDPEARVCEVAEVTRQVAALMGAGAQGERWPVRVTGRGGPLEAAIAPEALKQVLINLVQNGQEAMPDGGPIEIDLGSVNGLVTLEVLDAGTGIAADIIPRMFDPFFTTKGEVHGVGLGLFVAEGIIRAHGGALTAHNRPDGVGAVFRVELPSASAAEAGRPETREVGPA